MVKKKIRISDRVIGEGEPVFIISEIGSNFNKDIWIAKKLIRLSAKAGVDAVKFQTFKADTLTLRDAMFTLENGKKISQYNFFKEKELSEEDHYKLKDYAEKKKIVFLSTPSHKDDADLLERLGVPAFKTGSDDLTNYPFIRYLAKKGLPMIVSTGMSTLGEIEKTVETIKKAGNKDLILLHCTVGYPAKLENANLRVIKTLQSAFQVQVGYSDHTIGYLAPIIATMLGAVVIEKHLTLNRSEGGPDNDVAAEPEELIEIVRGIRDVEKALGSPVKTIIDQEIKWRNAARKSIVAAIDIKPDTKITEEMITIKRPGSGIHPGLFDAIIGRVAKKKILKNESINWDKF